MNVKSSRKAIIKVDLVISKKLGGKRVQSGKFSDVKKLLLRWFNQSLNTNIPISGPLLREKDRNIEKVEYGTQCIIFFGISNLNYGMG